jgi:hypothetical protein
VPRLFSLSATGCQLHDLSPNKDTALPHLGEKAALQFRAEAFNVFNRSNFVLPQGSHEFTGTLTDIGEYSENPLSTAGQTNAIATNRQRQLQLSLKVLF